VSKQCGPPRPQAASVEVPHLSHGCGSAPPFPWVWRLAPQSRSPTFPMGVALRHLSLGCGVSPLSRGPPPFPWVWLCATFPLVWLASPPVHVRTRFVLLAAASWTSAHTVHTCDTTCTLLSIVVLSMAVRAGGRVGCACEIRVLRAGSGSRPIPFACVVLVVPSVSHGPDSAP
jgi:hypothetical protein